MFLPLGFGNWPQKFPLAVLAIVLICTAWSARFFSTIKKNNEQIVSIMKDDQAYKTAMTAFLESACALKHIDKDNCDALKNTLEKKKDAKNTQKSETKTKKSASEKMPDFKSGFRMVEQIFKLSALMAGPPATWPREFKDLPEYENVKVAYDDRQKKADEVNQDSGLLTKNSQSFLTYLRASFTHGNWGHLLSNLLFLILVGVWVEQRMGSLMTALVFLLGSFAGLALQIHFNPSQPVLGASAGIFALIGAFFVFFFRQEVRFVFSLYFVFFRMVSLPAVWTFPLFYFVNEIIGGQDGIAHVAHLGGLGSGMVAALALQAVWPTAKGQIFLEEKTLYAALEKADSETQTWRAGHEILSWNCQNWPALELFLKKIQLYSLSVEKYHELWLQKTLRWAFVHYMRAESHERQFNLLLLIPTAFDLDYCLTGLTRFQILSFADRAANGEKYRLAKNLYGIALTRRPDRLSRDNIQRSLERIRLLEDGSGRDPQHG